MPIQTEASTANMQTLLIVDDDPETTSVLNQSLSKEGFRVLVANSGAEGVRLFRSERIGVSIVDIWMPEKDGIETIMEIRLSVPDAKIIAISGGGKLGLLSPLAWVTKLGAMHTLVKPFSSTELLDAVSEALAADALVRTPARG